MLFAPRIPTVEDATYEHFKRYVRSGGIAVITEGSLAETTSRYAPTDIATFDRGAGRVVVLREPLELGRPVAAAAREAFARSPFLTEADARRIHEEER